MQFAKLPNMRKIKLQKPVFKVISRILIFQSRISEVSFHGSVCFLFLLRKLQSSCLQKNTVFFGHLLCFDIHTAGIKRKVCRRICYSILKRCSTCEETTIIHQIFETNSSFHVKQRTEGKLNFCFSGDFYWQNFRF